MLQQDKAVYTPPPSIPLEDIDNSPLAHDFKLDERRVWREQLEELRTFWDKKAHIFQIEHEGVTYDCAVYSLDRRDRETEFEFFHFAPDAEGNIYCAPSPACRVGRYRETLKNYLVGPGNAEEVAARLLAERVDYMRPIRPLQDEDIITYDDIRAEMCRVLKTPAYQGQTWADFAARGGIRDEEIAEIVKRKFGSSGRSSSNTISVSREGSGYRLWMSWTKYRSEMEKPTLEGAATLAMAREILQTEHGLLNPDRPQMSLF